MATRCSPRGKSRPVSGKPGRITKGAAGKERTKGAGTRETGSGAIEEVAARAARLGITPERVLEEYARIAFADLRHFVEWGPDGRLVVKESGRLTDAESAAVSEVCAGAAGGGTRVKLYDKKAALDAIARHLGMFPAAPRHRQEDTPPDPAEDAREVLARRLARLAAGGAAS